MSKHTILTVVAAGIASTLVGFAVAKPVSYALPQESATLRPGSGAQAMQNNCLSCHSVDYIAMQPPKKGKAFWDAEVTKMIKVYKAPIDEADARTIADYLAQTY